ncbi:MAG: ABC transporter permease [Clostridium butyricum]|nr:ABC transporter permease [Clostridium butyricum]MDI9210786.1 ABC transporter permease [Clostridium butyricum]
MDIVKSNLKKYSVIAIVVYFVLAILFHNVAGKELYYKASKGNLESVQGSTSTYEITNHFNIKQTFVCKSDEIEYISLQFATFGRMNSGNINVKLINNDKILMDKNLDVSTLIDCGFVDIYADNPISNVQGELLDIEITSEFGENGNAVAPWYNPTLNIEGQQLYMNSEKVNGTICFKTFGRDHIKYSQYYWEFVAMIGAVLAIYLIRLNYKYKNGKKGTIIKFIESSIKYKFLIQQLVNRDFKAKYKRSVLGICWSFLNPLLTMLVQYIVFSTIFKSDIDNYPVYLLSGIILFNFFTEAVGMSLTSIVGNATLITKVYMPKCIYPITKVLSSTINLLISMIPLYIVIIIMNVKITKATLLLPFVILCVIAFCIGLGLILSSAMVFFRDTQFLWGVISLLWMYATPLFYPETIIPAQFMMIYKLNPMYHFIRFFRIVILYGTSPEPMVYFQCLLCAGVMLLIGSIVFKKTQDKFVLYI